MKYLLSDCYTRKAFDIYNILCIYFDPKEIILASDNGSRLKNKLIYNQQIYSLRKNSEDIFTNDLLLISCLYTNESIVYIPVEEDTTTLFYLFIKKNTVNKFLFCLPSETFFNIANDKKLLNKYCLEYSIPAPKIFEKKEILLWGEEEFIPLIIKPRKGSGSIGIIHIDNFMQLSKIKDIQLHDYVIQEKISAGKDVKGAFFLCQKGEVVSSYSHERIRTFPTDGGVTVFSKYSFNTQIIDIGKQLLKSLEWSGFAMIEFLWDEKESIYKIIEINPRLWGSILLSEFSGNKFVYNYVALCTDNKILKPKIKDYAKIRWIPFEILGLIKKRFYDKNFFVLDKKNTCYINFTYSNWFSSI